MKKKGELIFIGLVTFFSLFIFRETLIGVFKSKTIPLILSLAIIGMMVWEGVNVFLKEKGTNFPQEHEEKSKSSKAGPYENRFTVMIWLGISGIAIYVLGFLPAIFISSLIYFKIFLFRNNLHCVFSSLVVLVFVYVTFVVLANFNLYSGIIV